MLTTRSRARAQAAAAALSQAGPSAQTRTRQHTTAALAGRTDKTSEPPTRKKPQLSKKVSSRIKRVRSSSISIGREKSIQMAKKKLNVKENGKQKMKRVKSRSPVLNYVYVGNVDPSVTYEQMKDHFASCGAVTRIQFRCSRGKAITIGVPIAASQQTSRDKQYATVEFRRPAAVLDALKLHGTALNGCKLVVSISPADLPEVQDILMARDADLARRGKLGNTDTVGAAIKPVKPIPYQRTELLLPPNRVRQPPPPPKDRHDMLGFSFAKTVL